MTDHIEVLRRLIKRAGESADFTVSDAREADELLAALSAREGGEVPYGWIEPPTGNFVDHATKLEMPRDAATFTLPVFLHPAQPASQQGELDEFDRKRFEQAPCYLCGYNGAGYYQPATHPCANRYHASQQGEKRVTPLSPLAEIDAYHKAHPTGDRARSLLDEVIELQAKHYGNGMMTHMELSEWAKKAAAALDQENGNV
jgi:hypothetical protein